ncbi:hypothetical protein V2J09_003994 [Rumex salicifolius]
MQKPGVVILYDDNGTRHELFTGANYDPPFKFLGSGSYGVVFYAKNSQTKQVVAIKKIENAFQVLENAESLLREIRILRQLNHENVISLKDIIRPPSKDDFDDVYLVFECMDTDLEQIILDDLPLSDCQCQVFVYRLLRGLKYVHSANVLHRDLKPSNLLVKHSNLGLKIGDFGLARTISDNGSMTPCMVSLNYRAPELLLENTNYTAAIDIWSVGCILAEILDKKTLFPGKDFSTPDESSLGFIQDESFLNFVKMLPKCPRQHFSVRFANASPLAVDLLDRMLVFDPDKRITVSEALGHPYLAAHHDESNEPVCVEQLSADFEQELLTCEDIKNLIWKEASIVRTTAKPAMYQAAPASTACNHKLLTISIASGPAACSVIPPILPPCNPTDMAPIAEAPAGIPHTSGHRFPSIATVRCLFSYLVFLPVLVDAAAGLWGLL